MSKKKDQQTNTKPYWGRVKNHLKMGIVGLPNVGKSSLFNLLTKQEAKAENYPFCTIDPNVARVPVPDPRFDWLCEHYKPASRVPSYLEVVDIAGLIRGAASGEGLGNAFLSNISAVDGIFHLIRIFDCTEVTHVENTIDPIRDIEIINHELRLKDIENLEKQFEPLARIARSDPKKRKDLEAYEKALEWLKDGKDIRDATHFTARDIEVLRPLLFITAKPVVYLVNMSERHYIKQKNKWLPKIAQWIKENSPASPCIPFSAELEQTVFALGEEAGNQYLKENKTRSVLGKIVRAGFRSLNLINFFTSGSDEVRAWVLRKGSTAPQAGGVIHTDFEDRFIKAEVMKYDDLHELGTENEVKSAGKYKTEGKSYVVLDGDIILFKVGEGGGRKK